MTGQVGTRDAPTIPPCPVWSEPGNYHLEGRCDWCDARELARMPVEQVQARYRAGRCRQAMYEAYMHVWATSATRHKPGGWAVEPTDPEVTALAAAIRDEDGTEETTSERASR